MYNAVDNLKDNFKGSKDWFHENELIYCYSPNPNMK